MEFSSGFKGREQALIDLFTDTFSASEGVEEGDLIGGLVSDLMSNTAEGDIRVFVAREGDALIGAIFLTRLTYDRDSRTVFLLAPVAVATDRQGRGVGQGLLAHGLASLAREGVEIVLTYGDPDYYSRVGFRPVTAAFAPAPFALSQPHGWQGQSLTGQEMTPLAGACRCVRAFDNAALW